ncbi:MAG TPA: hypothetical protein VHO46_11380, partial [Bacteroidales bacterium]|nr:hypothetical protein [Bacteroidales bacterium]
MKNPLKKGIWSISYHAGKLILIMKLTTILIFTGIFQLSASVYSQNSGISLKMTDKTVREVLDQVQQNSDYRFFY